MSGSHEKHAAVGIVVILYIKKEIQKETYLPVHVLVFLFFLHLSLSISKK